MIQVCLIEWILLLSQEFSLEEVASTNPGPLPSTARHPYSRDSSTRRVTCLVCLYTALGNSPERAEQIRAHALGAVCRAWVDALSSVTAERGHRRNSLHRSGSRDAAVENGQLFKELTRERDLAGKGGDWATQRSGE